MCKVEAKFRKCCKEKLYTGSVSVYVSISPESGAHSLKAFSNQFPVKPMCILSHIVFNFGREKLAVR